MPSQPARRRYCSGRAEVFETSSDAPTSAMLRGASSACVCVGLVASAGTGLSALIEPAVEHGLGDAVLEHLRRAPCDHPATCAAHAIFSKSFLAVAEATHDLNRLVGDLKS